MNNRAIAFVSLLTVIGMSIGFGMLLGARLNAPHVVYAAPSPPVRLAPAATAATPSVSFADIVEESLPAVVSVISEAEDEGEEDDSDAAEDWWRRFLGPDRGPRPDQSQREGSGFVISSDGYVLTNHHVVEDADRVKVGLHNGMELLAEVVGTDPSIDLALLKVDGEGSMSMLRLGDSDSLRVGEWVIAIGNPLEYEHTVTVGVVSAKQRRVPIGSTDGGVVSFIQTDAAINFGNSGGPLLDSAGNVIGINTAIRRRDYAEGIGFALPINTARNVIEQLQSRGYVRRGYIGINMNRDGIDETVREYYGLPDFNGVIVDEVTEGGPAERAGLRRDDVIRKVDGGLVRDNQDLIGKIAARQPGDKVDLEVFRNGKVMNLQATLSDREEGLRTAMADRTGFLGDPPETRESTGLGCTVGSLTRRVRDGLELDDEVRGVVVTDVNFASEASQKGVQPGLVITHVNGKDIRTISDWDEHVEGLRSGDPVKLDLYGGGRSFSVFLRAPG